jgi:MtN3 and saliva related transmembrane protein
MTSLTRMMAFAVLPAGALVLGGCASLGIHDTQSLLAPSLDRSEIVGFVAGFGTTFAAIPDLAKMIKRRSSQGINPTMASIMAVFQIAWIYYGLLTVSRPVIVWNVVGVATNSLTVWAYGSFTRSEQKAAGGH